MGKSKKIDNLLAELLINQQNVKGTPKVKLASFEEIEAELRNFLAKERSERWIILHGLRGVGKTAILNQLYQRLTEEGVRTSQAIRRLEPTNVLFLSYDKMEKKMDLRDFLETYINRDYRQKEKVILLDEMQSEKNWARIIKVFIDETEFTGKNVFFVTTGSPALKLNNTADAARRSLEIHMEPMNFAEYLHIKKEKKIPVLTQELLLRMLLENPEELANFVNRFEELKTHYTKEDFEEFVTRGTLPHYLEHPVGKNHEQILRTLREVIDEDIRKINRIITDRDKIMELLEYLAMKEPGTTPYEKPSLLLDISRDAVRNILNAFIKADILIKVEPFKKPVGRPKAKKYYFTTPLFLSALAAGEEKKGLLYETLVLNALKRIVKKKVGRQQGNWKVEYDPRSKQNVDFLLVSSKKTIPVEVKAGKSIETAQLKDAIEYYKAPHGILVGDFKEPSYQEGIIILPFSALLLL